MSKKFLYIPTSGDDPDAVQPLVAFVKDLETRKQLLRKAYPQKLQSLQNLVYSHQSDDEIFKKELDDAIKTQLREDQAFFQKHQIQQNATVHDLINQVVDLQSKSSDLNGGNDKYNSIKSEYNQLDVALQPHNQPGKYLVNVNHNCLSVTDKNNYGLAPCNKYSNSQRFALHEIDGEAAYFGQYQQNPDPKSKPSYPYNVLKSTLSGACLESQDDGLYLKPCKDMQPQRWNPSSEDKMRCHK